LAVQRAGATADLRVVLSAVRRVAKWETRRAVSWVLPRAVQRADQSERPKVDL